MPSHGGLISPLAGEMSAERTKGARNGGPPQAGRMRNAGKTPTTGSMLDLCSPFDMIVGTASRTVHGVDKSTPYTPVGNAALDVPPARPSDSAVWNACMRSIGRILDVPERSHPL